jgi:outer membrane receptor protein involved in Fe transport
MNLKNSNLFKVLSAAGIVALSVGTVAGKASAQALDEPIELQDILLFGAKDTNELADTSASVGVTTAQEIEQYQLQGFRDVFRVMANVMDADWSDAGFIIRGVNSEGFVPGGAPLASVYVDGVQQTVNGARRGARGLWDVEQVEVYRGPQSTQSGRAALAGAIYVKTKDPVFEREAAFSGTIGNNNTYGAAMMFNEQLIENQLALRFAASFEDSESDLNYPNYENFERFHDFSHDSYYNLRGKLLLEPSAMPETRALLSYSFAHDAPAMDDIAGPGLGFDYDEDRGDFNDPVFTEARADDVHNVGLEVTHDFSEALKLTALSGFTHSLMSRPSVNEGTPGEINVTEGDMEDALATQELRLNYEGDRWSWVAGLYGSYEDFTGWFNRTSFYPEAWSRYDVSRSTRQTTNLAAFGEATYEFVPTWYVTAGGRADYTTQDTTEYFSRTSPVGGVPNVTTDFDGSLEEVNLVPKLGLSKDLTEFHTAGVTYSQGFRTGGSGFDRVALEPYTWEPETATTYEVYYKGRFFDERLTLNANVFFTEFQDQQIEVRSDPNDFNTSKIVNAASSESYGFEIEPKFDVTEQFSVFASIGYVHTEFKDFNDATLGDLSGFPFPEAPEWSVALGGQYTFRNGFYVGGDVKYTSSYLSAFGQSAAPYDWIDERVIVNAQAGYRTERWELNFFAENLLDERYFVFEDNYLGTPIAATLGDRRSYGVNAKLKF